MIGSSDSDSDDDKRVVRSAKDRRFDELKATCEEMRVGCLTQQGAGKITCVSGLPLMAFLKYHISKDQVCSASRCRRLSGLWFFVAEQIEHQ